MKQYAYIVTEASGNLSRYFIYHCAILDMQDFNVYHIRGDGKKITHFDEFCSEHGGLLKAFFFYSNKDIKDYFDKFPPTYNLLDNNCEIFANGFINYAITRQYDSYKIMFGLLFLVWVLNRR